MNRIDNFESFPSQRKTESSKPIGDAFKEKMQKIEKTEEETEQDKEKFLHSFHVEQRKIEEEECFCEAGAAGSSLFASASPSRGPAELAAPARPNMAIPFNPSYEGFKQIAEQAIPSPPAFPPPSVNESIEAPSPQPAKELPQSQAFWESFDLPDEPPPRRNLEEMNQPPAGRKKRLAEALPQPSKKKKLDSQQELLSAIIKPKKEELSDEELSATLLRPSTREEKKTEGALESATERGKEKKEPQAPGTSIAKKTKEEKKIPQSEQELQEDLAQPKEEELSVEEISETMLRPTTQDEKKKLEPAVQARNKTKGSQSVAAQSIKKTEAEKEREEKPRVLPDPLPMQFASLAQAAQTSAASYLNPQTEALFRQMVGAIIFVQKTTPGIIRTEILLNGSELRGSPFYNTTIVIEQHAAAPGAYNISLQGSPQAIQIFNNNLASLSSAFQTAYDKREINFRIVRLETSLSSKWSAHPRKKESESDEGFEE